MAAMALQRLLQPLSITNSEVRSLEFINSKFQFLVQLRDEDMLQRVVDDTRRQSCELRIELQKSQTAVDELIRHTLFSTRKHLASTRALQLARHTLADGLSLLSSELISSFNHVVGPNVTLLEELESLHRSLKELENVKSYVSVIERALRLSEAAVAEARGTQSSTGAWDFSPSSLEQYCQLHFFVTSVTSLFSTVENTSQDQSYVMTSQGGKQPLKVVTFLSFIRDSTWTDIKGVLSSRLLKTAEKMGWPQEIEYISIPFHVRESFETEFLDLVKLQDIGDEVHATEPHWNRDGIYPIQALTYPIALRFKFHFESKRGTNRMDKPEWYFTHVLNVAHTHRSFLKTTIQALLSNTKHKHIDAFREFTLHLLPSLTRKLRHTVPRLLTHPSLLAHTVYQALAFDASLREQCFSLQGTTAAGNSLPRSKDYDQQNGIWEGVSEQILGRKEWFEAWLDGERKFADDQYNDIISSPDAWQIPDDSDDMDTSGTEMDFKPTNSARKVKGLIERITDRYQPLPRFTFRTRFLIGIQIPILESYHSRISSSLDAFESISSSFVRAVPGALAGQVGHGIDTRKLTSGVEGVGRLVKAGISACYIATQMERWGEDLFFLELWSEINARAALRARALVHPLLPDPSKEMISTTLHDVEAASSGTIFQELVTQYRSLGERAWEMIVRHTCSEVEAASKPYFSSQSDDFQIGLPNDRGVSIPTTLAAPISLLSSHLVFLARFLPNSSTVILYRRIASTLADVILQRGVLPRGMGRRISLGEAKQVAEECLLWVEACRVAAGHLVRRIEGPWVRLLEAIRLLTLEQDQFRAAVERIFNIGTGDLEKLRAELKLAELDLHDIMAIARLREECWQ